MLAVLSTAWAQDPGLLTQKPLSVDQRDVVVRQSEPSYPSGVERASGAEDICWMTVTIDDLGLLLSAEPKEPEGCEEPFATAFAEEIRWRWEFQPVIVDGEAVPAVFHTHHTFKAGTDPSWVGTMEWWADGEPPGDLEALTEAGEGVVVKARRRVEFDVPPDAWRFVDGSEVKCLVRFYVQADGTPLGVVVEGCPMGFSESLLQTAQMWRFYAHQEEAESTQLGVFSLQLRLRLK